jgi:hypothetical protein
VAAVRMVGGDQGDQSVSPSPGRHHRQTAGRVRLTSASNASRSTLTGRQRRGLPGTVTGIPVGRRAVPLLVGPVGWWAGGLTPQPRTCSGRRDGCARTADLHGVWDPGPHRGGPARSVPPTPRRVGREPGRSRSAAPPGRARSAGRLPRSGPRSRPRCRRPAPAAHAAGRARTRGAPRPGRRCSRTAHPHPPHHCQPAHRCCRSPRDHPSLTCGLSGHKGSIPPTRRPHD